MRDFTTNLFVYPCFRTFLVSFIVLLGCLNAPVSAQNVTITTQSANCQSNGQINVVDQGGGSQPFTYALLNGPGVPQPPAFLSSNLPGGGGYNFLALQSGTYTVGVVDNDGNEKDYSVTVGGNYQVMDYTPVPSLNACGNGTRTGKITVTGLTGGNPPYRYKLTRPADTGFLDNGGVFDNLTPGQNYEVQVWDACDNFQTRQVQIPATAQPNISGPSRQYQGCTGAIVATFGASGGTAPYTFQLISGPPNDPAVGSPNTTGVFNLQPNSNYTLQVTDGCGGQTTTSVYQGGLPPLSVEATGASSMGCAGGTMNGAGATKITVSGGITPYSMVVLKGTGSCNYPAMTLTNLQPDGDGYSQVVENLPRPCTFEVTITDACNNVMTQPFSQVLAGDGILGSHHDVSCPDDNSTNLNLNFNATYGPPYAPTPPFMYTLVNSNGVAVAGYPVTNYDGQSVALPAGVYTYSISDACGANTGPVSVTILAYEMPTVTISSTNQCINAGQINLMGINKNPLNPGPGTYRIIGGPDRNGESNTTGVFSNLLSGGNYTFEFNDGCHAVTVSRMIPPYQQPTFEVTFGALCPGQTSASIQAFNLGPGAVVRPFTYEIIALNTTGGLTRPPQVDSLFAGLAQGQYNVRGADACNNSFTFLGKIAPLPTPVIKASRGPYCSGQLFRIRVGQPVYGATYSYYRDGVLILTTTSIVARIPAELGKYRVVVAVTSGGISCSATSDVDFELQITGNLTVTNPAISCDGGPTDLTAPAVTAGSDPGSLAYFQDSAATIPLDATTGPANAIKKAGDYYIRLVTNSGCTIIRKVTVSFRPPVTATLSSVTACPGQSVSLVATGGTSYVFSSPGGNGNTLSVNPAITTVYSVTATDENGCSSQSVASGTVTVQPLPLISVISANCQDLTTYAVSFTATPGSSLSTSAGILQSSTLVSGIPSGQVVTLTAGLGGCPVSQTALATVDCQTTAASLGDFVWQDTNRNGVFDTGEPGIVGVTVTLISNGTVVASTTTTTEGLYSFTGLTPGIPYSVSFTAPASFSGTTQTAVAGNAANDSNPDPTTGLTAPTTLTATENNSTIDAGFFLLQPKLTLTKSVDKSTAAPGDVLTYTVVLTNSGLASATAVTVQEQLSPGTTYVANSAAAPAGSTTNFTASGGNWFVPAVLPGQSLTLTLQARVDSMGVLVNVVTIPGTATAAICSTVPVTVCAGSGYAYRLTAPAGTSFQWYNGNTPIAGATTNTLIVSTPGSYSVSVDSGLGGGCTTGSCCPFVVVETPAPSYSAVGIMATCNSQTVTVANADARILLKGLGAGTFTYQIAPAVSFAGAAPLSASPQAVPGSGLLPALLAGGQVYTVRVFGSNGCFADSTITIGTTTCSCPPPKCVPFAIRQTGRSSRTGGN